MRPRCLLPVQIAPPVPVADRPAAAVVTRPGSAPPSFADLQRRHGVPDLQMESQLDMESQICSAACCANRLLSPATHSSRARKRKASPSPCSGRNSARPALAIPARPSASRAAARPGPPSIFRGLKKNL